jgi:hypothetical protein
MARRHFVNSPYFPDAEGRLRPVTPASCPRDRCGAGCNIVMVGFRKRSHGPGFPLAIGFCGRHLHFFTIYPPGWFPYGRRPLVPVGYDGKALRDENGKTPWKMTFFGALVDAAQGIPWPEELNRGSCDEVLGALGCLRTQRRHLEMSLEILGISRGTERRERENVALSLGVDLGLVHEVWRRSRVRPRDGPWWKLRGAEGAKILESLRLSERLTSNFLRRWHRKSQSPTPPSGTRIGRPQTSL